MASDATNPGIELYDSTITVPSDSENYSANQEMSSSAPSTSGSPLILYKTPSIWGVLRGAAINLILPFVNGLMLGFGELFAHEAAFRLGWSNTKISTFRSRSLRAPTQRGQLGSSISGNPFRWAAPSAIGPAAIRFNSTSSSEKPSLPDMPGQLPEFDDPALFDPASIPEGIGYLHQLGLSYGIGPSSVMQWVIEHIHLWTGMPWYASIFATGILLRLALLKPMINSSDNAARMNNAKPFTDPVRAEWLAAKTKGDLLATQQKQLELKDISAKHGIKMYKSLVPMLQIPFAFGMFRVVNGMASLPVPGLAQESLWWLKDLTVADPLYVLPLLTSACLYQTLKRGGETGSAAVNGPVMKIMQIAMPTISGLFMMNFSSALQLYFVGTGAFALGQTYLVNDKRFRKWMNLTQTVIHANPSTPESLKMSKQFLQEQAKELENEQLSFVDRKLRDGKSVFQSAATQAQEKVQEMVGGGPTKNADGSTVPPPRLTPSQKREADEYEKNRLFNYQREIDQRNEALRKEHMRALAQQKGKAKQDIQRHKNKASRK
ncbi:hypothetical protein N7495_001271 [Penicillium taxi]|uniref:uncharacterized protein n=1 Tax=Penicillium taxi TaxID=168475 RepID=UPI0025457B92|nr:uncharacterized protein N7495_001271 [Penicillium taxi]KAJ5908589.1 hypothetical protein N7495_001271 [Penicillium taxi]